MFLPYSFWTLFALCLQDQIVTRRVWRAEFQSWVTADVCGYELSRCHICCRTHLRSDKKPSCPVFLGGFTTPFAYIYMDHNDEIRQPYSLILRITTNWAVYIMKVTRLFLLFIWPQDDQCFGMTPGSEAKSFNFCVILGCIIPGHASEKSHGCLGYRMEYTLSCLIGRFTAQYGNPYEQTRTMESHKFSCWLIWRKQRCFLSSQTFCWPGNISCDPAYGQKREDDAGRAFRKSVGHVRFLSSDMKENFCQDSFKVFVFLPLFGEDFQFDYFQMGWN